MKHSKLPVAILVSFLFLSSAAFPQTFTTLSKFDGTNGDEPASPLVQGRDGNFYGTTQYGGAYDQGEVFRVSPSGKLRIHSFACCQDGSNPDGLVLGADGVLYGTAETGGAYTRGTVFKITPNGVLTTLYSFCAKAGCPDGNGPMGLVLGYDGNFYGTTIAGGTNNNGTVYKITPAGRLTTLYTFCAQANCSDGSWPNAPLIQAADGDFYGTTYQGGSNESCGYLQPGCGTVFKITSAGTLVTLYSFCPSSYPNCPDGNSPRGGLAEAADGSFYGTTYGIPYKTGGTIFNITSGGVLSTLYTFCSQPECADGEGPIGNVVEGSDGNLYGTTLNGGANHIAGSIQGTIFKIANRDVLVTLYSFCSQAHCNDGSEPTQGLVQSTNGLLYGNTFSGGGGSCDAGNGCGTLFNVDANLPPFVAFVRPGGRIGQTGGILGQGFTGTTSVVLNGTPTSFTVISDTYLIATVPPGATTGYVTVTTPSGVLRGNVPFHVLP